MLNPVLITETILVLKNEEKRSFKPALNLLMV
jgi:hypothetical protein